MNEGWQRRVEAAIDHPDNAFRLDKLAIELLRGEPRVEPLLVEPRGGLQDGGIDFVARSQGVRATLVLHGQVSCQKNWKSKLNRWLRDMQRSHPEARNLVFVSSEAIPKKHSLASAELERTGRDLQFRDRAWFLDMLARPENRWLARDYLGVPTRSLRCFITGPERRAQLATSRTGGTPAAAPRFVGRSADLAKLGEQLREHDTLLVIGPGGIGKSRLAVEAADAPAIQAALPDATWWFWNGVESLGEADLAELPGMGTAVLVIDDPQRAPAREALSRLQVVADHPDWRGRIKIVLTTRPEWREATRRLLSPARTSSEILLQPLSNARVNELLKSEPLSIASEPARTTIISKAAGIPRIAEALAGLFHEGGVRALGAAQPVARLLEEVLSDLGEQQRSTLPRDVFSIVAAFTELRGPTEEIQEALADALGVSRREVEASLEALARAGWIARSDWLLQARPDTFGEVAVATRYFTDDQGPPRFERQVWEGLGRRRREQVLERLTAAALLRDAPERLGEWLRAQVLRLMRSLDGASSHGTRFETLRLGRIVAAVCPADVLALVEHAAALPEAPDNDDDRCWGFSQSRVLEACVETVKIVLARGRSIELQRQGVSCLLDLLSRQAGAMEGGGQLPRRSAAETLREVLRPGWSSQDGGSGLGGVHARVAAVLDWARQDWSARARETCSLLALACRLDDSWQHVSPDEANVLVVRESRLTGADPAVDYLVLVTDALLDALEHVDDARHAALQALFQSWWNVVRRAPASQDPSRPLIQPIQAAAQRAFDCCSSRYDELSAPSKAQLFEWLAQMKEIHRDPGAVGCALFERLKADQELRSLRGLGGHVSSFDPDGRPLGADRSRIDRECETVVQELVQRAVESADGLEAVLALIESLASDARSAGLQGITRASLVASGIAGRAPEVARQVVRARFTRGGYGLDALAHAALSALWREDPVAAEAVSREGLAQGTDEARRLVLSSIGGALPDRALRLARECLESGGTEVVEALMAGLRWVEPQRQQVAAELLLDAARVASPAQVNRILGMLAPHPGARLDPSRPIVPPNRTAEYARLLAAVITGDDTEGDDRARDEVEDRLRFDWLAESHPEELVTAVRHRLDSDPQGTRIAALQRSVEAALGSLPRGSAARNELLESCLDELRSGRRTYLNGRLVHALVHHEEARPLCDAELERLQEGSWRVLDAVMRPLSDADFKEILADLVATSRPARAGELAELVGERVLPSGQAFSGSLSARYAARAGYLSEWRHSESPKLAQFARWIEELLLASGRSWEGACATDSD